MLGSGLKIDLNFYDVIDVSKKKPQSSIVLTVISMLYIFIRHTHTHTLTHTGHTCFLPPTLLSTGEKNRSRLQISFFILKDLKLKTK